MRKLNRKKLFESSYNNMDEEEFEKLNEKTCEDLENILETTFKNLEKALYEIITYNDYVSSISNSTSYNINKIYVCTNYDEELTIEFSDEHKISVNGGTPKKINSFNNLFNAKFIVDTNKSYSDYIDNNLECWATIYCVKTNNSLFNSKWFDGNKNIGMSTYDYNNKYNDGPELGLYIPLTEDTKGDSAPGINVFFESTIFTDLIEKQYFGEVLNYNWQNTFEFPLDINKVKKYLTVATKEVEKLLKLK